MSSTENLPKNGSTVLTETTPVAAPAAPTIIRDVEELKASLKEEKRARAATAEVEEPTAATQDQPLTPDSERRKRRKVDGDDSTEGEGLDGPLKTTEKDIPNVDSIESTESKSAKKDKADPTQPTLPSETPEQDDKVADTAGAEKKAGDETVSSTEANECSTAGACAKSEAVAEQAAPLEAAEAPATKEEDKAVVEPIR